MNISVMLSGSGRTLDNFLRCKVGNITNVVSSRNDVRGVDIARNAGIPLDVTKVNSEIFEILDGYKADLVCLAGWLSLIEVPERYSSRIMNIHPSLLPMFGGAGMYGNHVHEAVLKNGCKISGCTVHFVDNKYDNGPIIVQNAVLVLEEDQPCDLAARVFQAECQAYPRAIRLFSEGRLRVFGRLVKVLSQ